MRLSKFIGVSVLFMWLPWIGFVNGQTSLWRIGTNDRSPSEFALAPDGYKAFLENDFGHEDRFYLVGFSDPTTDFPYVLPGPADTWGGTWPTSGWRTHEVNILFGLKNDPSDGDYRLKIHLTDYAGAFPPLVKVRINGQTEKIRLVKPSNDLINFPKPKLDQPPIDTLSLTGILAEATPTMIEVAVHDGMLKSGGNEVTITILEGSWIMFDQVALEGPLAELVEPDGLFVRNVRAAEYEIASETENAQPLLVNVEHLDGEPLLEVELDGKIVFSRQVIKGSYEFEVPMPVVDDTMRSMYRILVNDKEVESGSIERRRHRKQTYADYVDTRIGTAHSRWMIAPGPWMPFSMVKLSPDNQNNGWQAGYEPSFENIGCFSHIHEWTMGGLGIMPTNGELNIRVGDESDPDSGYRSRIDKSTEEAPIGYYKVYLSDPGIWAEVTATTRCGFHRYTFPDEGPGRIMIDLHVQAEYDYQLPQVEITRISDYRIEGFSHQITPRPKVWSDDADQEYTVHFVIEFDQPIVNSGGWIENNVLHVDTIRGEALKNAGFFVEFDTGKSSVVQVRCGISLVSVENAALNLKSEVTQPFGWDFDAVICYQREVWNGYFSRVQITTDDRLEKIRFYTNFYRALCRNTWSDVNGEWVAADGSFQKLADPNHLALGCDAFWNTFWNLNQFWNLATPEWSSKWVNSQLAMYKANGWLAKGPAGMKYIPVMVAEHEIPLIVSAYQMGIRDFDVEKAYEAAKKMQTTVAGPVAGGFAGNRDLVPYLSHHYVPWNLGRFSNTLEYAYDDWTVSQFALALGKTNDYRLFKDRGDWWRNAFNPETGFAQMRDSNGDFVQPFDPFKTGRNHHYVEGNAWQLSFFVPQDLTELVNLVGKDRFVERLDWGFKASETWRYNAPNDQYWDYPVVHGNQQSMHFAFLFNWAGHPWLTQKWSRSILERYYGSGVGNAYPGDEDQGQMSGWFLMASIGLFQTDGGCRVDPIYEIASPIYERVVIDLGGRYGRGDKFVIEAKNVSRKNSYIQRAQLNGRDLNTFWFPATELLKGGTLVLEMGDQPNREWGIGSLPKSKVE